MSLIASRLSEPLEVQAWVATVNPVTLHPEGAGYGEPVTIKGVVSSQTSDESVDMGSDIMSRRLIVRVFGGTSAITGKSRVKCRGEWWQVDGIPVTSKGVSGMKLTTFYISKQGVGSDE